MRLSADLIIVKCWASLIVPINLTLIPPKVSPPPKGPSAWMQAGLFLLATLIGSLMVVLNWPKGQPTSTWSFWLLVAVASPLAALFLALLPYSSHAGMTRYVRSRNEVRETRKQALFELGRKPLALLGASYLISAIPSENQIEGIATGKLLLTARAKPDQSTTVRARWLDAPPFVEGRNPTAYDDERQQQVLQDLFAHLQDQLGRTLKALPAGMPLQVQLHLATSASLSDCTSWWNEAWQQRGLPTAQIVPPPEEPGLMQLDAWLDQSGGLQSHATLIVAVQLHAILRQDAPLQSAEAGVALLLLPNALAAQHRLTPIATVHRPMKGGLATLNHTLKYALIWGRATAENVANLWQTGFDDSTQTPLTNALRDAQINLKKDNAPSGQHNLDHAIGHAGIAAGWLALACAARYVPWAASPQLVALQDQQDTLLAVVAAPIDADKE